MSDEKALKSQARMNEEIHRTRTGSVSYMFNIATRIRGSEGPSVSTERLIPTSFPNPFKLYSVNFERFGGQRRMMCIY